MMRIFWNYLIDLMLLAMGLLCTVTGVVKWPGLVYSLGLGYQALPMDTITQVHDWTGLILGVLVILHVAMHLKWPKEMSGKVLRNWSGEHEKTRIHR